MYWNGFLTALKAPNKRAMYSLMRDLRAVIRFHFLHSAIQCGLVAALREPATREALAGKLSVVREDLLDGLLDMGLALGELRLRHGMYHAGTLFQGMATESGDSLAACVEAFATYYASIYRGAPARLTGAPNGRYLEEIGPLVARFSRVSEPYVASFLRKALAGRKAARVLDVGCGSGGFLFQCAAINPAAMGVGLEKDPAVAEAARENLRLWGLEERFQVLTGDLRQPPATLGGPFDLALLVNALYYFPPEERMAVLQDFRQHLAPNGALVLVCSFQGKGRNVLAANLNLATCSMHGCWPLPDLDETQAQLRQAGFTRLRVARLMPSSTLFGILAHSGEPA